MSLKNVPSEVIKELGLEDSKAKEIEGVFMSFIDNNRSLSEVDDVAKSNDWNFFEFAYFMYHLGIHAAASSNTGSPFDRRIRESAANLARWGIDVAPEVNRDMARMPEGENPYAPVAYNWRVLEALAAAARMDFYLTQEYNFYERLNNGNQSDDNEVFSD